MAKIINMVWAQRQDDSSEMCWEYTYICIDCSSLSFEGQKFKSRIEGSAGVQGTMTQDDP